MDTVLLLISSRQGPAITPEIIEAAKSCLTDYSRPIHHAPNAIEFTFSAQTIGLEEKIRTKLSGQPIDIAIFPTKNRRKKLLIADMDSTFIHEECIDEMGRLAGAGDAIVAITQRAMRGELGFEDALKERVALMAGLEAGAIKSVKENHITFTDGGRQLVQVMRAGGAHTALVSGGFTHFTDFVARHCGFHQTHANKLVIENGKLTGKIEEPILGCNAKTTTLHELCHRLAISPNDVIAVGDGANDLGMIGVAGLGVAFRAKPVVREAADIRIEHSGLDALLWIQGLNPDATL